MNEHDLDQALRALARETAPASAAPHIEASLRRAVRARRPAPIWTRAAAAAVALVLLGGGLARWWERPAPPAPPVRPVTQWYYSAGVPPVENGLLIRMEVPAATAARFGVLAPGPVQADLIIGDDGLTRAIRFVQHNN